MLKNRNRLTPIPISMVKRFKRWRPDLHEVKGINTDSNLLQKKSWQYEDPICDGL